MGLGDYISTKTKIEYIRMEKRRETWEVEKNLEGEKVEVYEIFVAKGYER